VNCLLEFRVVREHTEFKKSGSARKICSLNWKKKNTGASEVTRAQDSSTAAEITG
jgi:hypothetical protein